jgi:hypothetical protein
LQPTIGNSTPSSRVPFHQFAACLLQSFPILPPATIITVVHPIATGRQRYSGFVGHSLGSPSLENKYSKPGTPSRSGWGDLDFRAMVRIDRVLTPRTSRKHIQVGSNSSLSISGHNLNCPGVSRFEPCPWCYQIQLSLLIRVKRREHAKYVLPHCNSTGLQHLQAPFFRYMSGKNIFQQEFEAWIRHEILYILSCQPLAPHNHDATGDYNTL